MILPVNTSMGKYNIVLERGSINDIGSHYDINKRALIVTDSGVPSVYAYTKASSSV